MSPGKKRIFQPPFYYIERVSGSTELWELVDICRFQKKSGTVARCVGQVFNRDPEESGTA